MITYNYSAFVTGASRGIGRAIVLEIASKCSEVFVGASTLEAASNAALDFGLTFDCCFHPVGGDLENCAAYADYAASIIAERADKLDLLVLNAGYYVEGEIESIADVDFERNMRVNCISSHYLVQRLMPLIKKSPHGRIIIIGSTAAYEPYPIVPTYGLAKWGLRGYAANLRRELMKHDIGVSFVSPGGTQTDMWADVEIDPGRLLEPSDIGKLVAAILTLSPQAVVEELIVRPMKGDMHE